MSDVPHYFLYGETAPSDALDYLYIASLEESLPKHNWEIHPHRHNNLHQLLIVEEGSVLVQVHDRRSEERGPCLLSIPPREVHGFVHQPGVRGYIFTISESFLRGTFAESERQEFPSLFTDILAIHPDPESKLSSEAGMLVRQLVHEYRHPGSGQACVIGAYLKILLVLLSRSATQLSSPDRNYDAKFSVYELFLKVLEKNFREHLSVHQYSEKLGLTESRLNRLCQKFAGQNALQIIHGRVITEAKRKLIYADLSVNEVAYELGFKDPAYFSRFFTKHCDEAPGQFKKRLRDKGTA